MTRSIPQRSLARVLETDPQLAQWSNRQRQEAALTRQLRRYLPRAIGERVRVVDAREAVLEIAAGSGAIAAAVRQRVPDLRYRFERDGHAFAAIRVRILIAASGEAPMAAKRSWNSTDAAPLFTLADRLSDGPLKAALARWSRKARGR